MIKTNNKQTKPSKHLFLVFVTHTLMREYYRNFALWIAALPMPTGVLHLHLDEVFI